MLSCISSSWRVLWTVHVRKSTSSWETFVLSSCCSTGFMRQLSKSREWVFPLFSQSLRTVSQVSYILWTLDWTVKENEDTVEEIIQEGKRSPNPASLKLHDQHILLWTDILESVLFFLVRENHFHSDLTPFLAADEMFQSSLEVSNNCWKKYHFLAFHFQVGMIWCLWLLYDYVSSQTFFLTKRSECVCIIRLFQFLFISYSLPRGRTLLLLLQQLCWRSTNKMRSRWDEMTSLASLESLL